MAQLAPLSGSTDILSLSARQEKKVSGGDFVTTLAVVPSTDIGLFKRKN